MRYCRVEERPVREWWAVLGTVTEALEGLTSCGLGSGAVALADDDPGVVDDGGVP